jgi:hypothetical protein
LRSEETIMDEGRSGEGNGEEKEVGEADLHGVDSLIEALREVRTSVKVK